MCTRRPVDTPMALILQGGHGWLVLANIRIRKICFFYIDDYYIIHSLTKLWTVKKLIILAFSLLFLLSYASNYTYFKAFSDTNVSNTEVGLVEGGFYEFNKKSIYTTFEKVDGVEVKPFLQTIRQEGFWRIAVLPGKRVITARIQFNGKGTRVNFELDIEKGWKYTFTPKIDGKDLITDWTKNSASISDYNQ